MGTYGMSVNLFRPAGERKFLLKKNYTLFGFVNIAINSIMSIISIISIIYMTACRFMFLHTLDQSICPNLVKLFDLPIWHPRNETELDLLFDWQLDV